MPRITSLPGGKRTSFVTGADALVVEPSGGTTGWMEIDDIYAEFDARYKIGCRLTEAGGAQTITTGTWEPITFDTETFDHGGCHDTGSNTERITIPSGEKGVYIVGGVVSFDGDATGTRQVRIAKNGVGYHTSNPEYTPDASAATKMGVSTCILLDATDYVTLDGRHSKGSDLDTVITDLEFWAYQLTKIP